MVKQYPKIKNRLVSYANDYDIKYLYLLFEDVLDQFDKRKINHSKKYDDEIEKTVKSMLKKHKGNIINISSIAKICKFY